MYCRNLLVIRSNKEGSEVLDRDDEGGINCC